MENLITLNYFHRIIVAAAFLAVGFLPLNCATSNTAPEASTAEINKGKMVPDAPGEAGETGPKSDMPQTDPTKPGGGAKTAKTSANAATNGEMTVNFDWVNVRKGPGMKFEVVRMIKKGTKVGVTGKENGIWSKIGESEYVTDKFLSN